MSRPVSFIDIEEHGYYLDVVPYHSGLEMARFTVQPILPNVSILHIVVQPSFYGADGKRAAEACLNRITGLKPHLLIGIIPSVNRLACRYAKSLGFEEVKHETLFKELLKSEPIKGDIRLTDAKVFMWRVQ